MLSDVTTDHDHDEEEGEGEELFNETMEQSVYLVPCSFTFSTETIKLFLNLTITKRRTLITLNNLLLPSV